jgi:transcription initiation factor TFIIIB Brf1 subunit/transcription initiation factor TFIIB
MQNCPCTDRDESGTCTSCGCMYDDAATHFVAEVEFDSAGSAMATACYASTRYTDLSSKAATGFEIASLIDHCASACRLEDNVRESAKALFRFAREHKAFGLQGRRREAVVGACVYLAWRNATAAGAAHATLTLSDIAHQLGMQSDTQLKRAFSALQLLWVASRERVAQSAVDPSAFVTRIVRQLALGAAEFRVSDATCTAIATLKTLCGAAHPIGICGAGVFVALRQHHEPAGAMEKIAKLTDITAAVMRSHVDLYDEHGGAGARKAEETRVKSERRKVNRALRRKKATRDVYEAIRAQLVKEGALQPRLCSMAELKQVHVRLLHLQACLRPDNHAAGAAREALLQEHRQLKRHLQEQSQLRRTSHPAQPTAPAAQPMRKQPTDEELDDDEEIRNAVLSADESSRKRKLWEQAQALPAAPRKKKTCPTAASRRAHDEGGEGAAVEGEAGEEEVVVEDACHAHDEGGEEEVVVEDACHAHDEGGEEEVVVEEAYHAHDEGGEENTSNAGYYDDDDDYHEDYQEEYY